MNELRLRRKFSLGLLVNPFAGIGGALALKGSDGANVRKQALDAGAEQLAMQKTHIALNECINEVGAIDIFTGSGDMGETTARALGFSVKVLHTPLNQQTEIEDTLTLLKAFLAHKVDFILFAGGDGTARNVCSVIGTRMPVLGIPAGCKIHSSVYAITPKAAGKVLSQVVKGELLSLQDAEVRDIDESKFRQGQVLAKHYGEMQVPLSLSYIQAVKMGGKESDELLLDDIADYVLELMQDHEEHYFVMGSGSTVAAIMERAGLTNTLLGVDVIFNGEVVANDVSAQQLLALTRNKPTKLIITLIGGQGHIFGRGNQQLSAEFLRSIPRSNIVLVATKAKLQALGNKGLISDCGDADLDTDLSGPISVITGYKDQVLYFVRGDA